MIPALFANKRLGSGTPIHIWGLLLLLWFSPSAFAQEQNESAPENTRANEIQTERKEKAAHLSPEVLTPGEQSLGRVKDSLERLFQEGNVHLKIGGLPSGSGFAIGPIFQFSNATDAVRGEFWAVGSISQYYQANAAVTFPKLATRSLALTIGASRSDAPSLNFYGIGPSSRKGDRTDYRQEETAGEMSLKWAPFGRSLILKTNGGEVLYNIGPGIRNDITSTELRYSPLNAPGLDVQTNFVRAASSIELDGRDSEGDPHKGARVALQYQHYWDLKFVRYSFARASADVQTYLPFFNRKRVIALRGRTDFTRADRNQIVPFYLQPVLGDAADFRGYRPYRYRDNNLLLFNAEYRWEVSSGFDMALFADSGRVFEKPRQINLSHMKNSAGFGFRFKNRDAVVMRIDTGFSREGWQLWLKFGNVF